MPSFYPPNRTLMGPGPSDVHPRVLSAMARPTIGHLDPVFVAFMSDLKALLQYAFQTENPLTFPVSGPGSAGMETCFVNLVEPGEKVIVCQNGVFGGRMQANVERCGGEAILVEDEWGKAVTPEKVEQALKDHPDAKIVAFVHAETSTGALSDAQTLAALAHEHDCLVIVDAVTSLGGVELNVDQWQLDAVYSGTQKCLSAPPGLSPVTFNAAAQEKITSRKSPVQSWFMDLNLVMNYWGEEAQRSYHHTAPINSLYALHEALLILKEEGLESAWERHWYNHLALKAGLEVLGFDYLPVAEECLPQLNAVSLPQGLDEALIRSQLLSTYQIEIGAGLGPLAGKIWRIGQMGYSSREENIYGCLEALETLLKEQGLAAEAGEAEKAARKAYFKKKTY